MLQEDRRREFRKKGVRKIEVDIEPLEAREHVDLHLRKDLAAVGLQRMRQRRVRENAALLDFFRPQVADLLPGQAGREPRGRPDGNGFAARHLHLWVELRLEDVPLSRSLRCAAITFGLFALSFFMISSGD